MTFYAYLTSNTFKRGDACQLQYVSGSACQRDTVPILCVTVSQGREKCITEFHGDGVCIPDGAIFFSLARFMTWTIDSKE